MIPVSGWSLRRSRQLEAVVHESRRESASTAKRSSATRSARRLALPPGEESGLSRQAAATRLSEIADALRHQRRRDIRSWNDLNRRRHIYPGQKLAIYVATARPKPRESRRRPRPTMTIPLRETKHVVERGETFFSISRQYSVSCAGPHGVERIAGARLITARRRARRLEAARCPSTESRLRAERFP